MTSWTSRTSLSDFAVSGGFPGRFRGWIQGDIFTGPMGPSPSLSLSLRESQMDSVFLSFPSGTKQKVPSRKDTPKRAQMYPTLFRASVCFPPGDRPGSRTPPNIVRGSGPESVCVCVCVSPGWATQRNGPVKTCGKSSKPPRNVRLHGKSHSTLSS